MSEAPPVLLNMGADVASATGMNPMPGQSAATGSHGNEFAGVLQSALNPVSPQSNSNPQLTKQLDANPLLFVQAEGMANPLLAPGDMKLEALPTGNALPAGEQELAWQTLLTAHDSQDPGSPQVVLAADGEQAYQPEELMVEDLLPVNQVQGTDKPGRDELPEIHSQQPGTGPISTAKPIDTANEPVPVSAAIMAAHHVQDAPSAAKPVIIASEEDVLQKMSKSQPAASRTINPVQLDASPTSDEAQGVNKQLFQEKIEQLAGHGKQDAMETVNNKTGSIMGDSDEQAAVAKPASLTGVSTYAAVSGVGSSMPPSPSTAPAIAHLTIPPQNPAWGDTVGDRVQWMAAQNIQEAKIRLHPQELGMLEIRIQIGSDQQTTIAFSSPHAQVRDALETAIPRLREMFSENGLTLGDVNVSHHSSSEQDRADRDNNNPANTSPSSHSHSTHEPVDVLPPHQLITQGNGMLDLYA